MSLLQTKYGEIHKRKTRKILLFIKTLAYILCTYFDKSAIFFLNFLACRDIRNTHSVNVQDCLEVLNIIFEILKKI